MQAAGEEGPVHRGQLQVLGRLRVPDHQQPLRAQALPQHLGLPLVRHAEAEGVAVLEEHVETGQVGVTVLDEACTGSMEG